MLLLTWHEHVLSSEKVLQAYAGSCTDVVGVSTVRRSAKMLIMSSRLMAKLQNSRSWLLDLDQVWEMAFVGSNGLLMFLLRAE